MCLAWLPAAQPAGPLWDLSCGQIFHTPPPSTPARMHLLPSQTQSPGLWVPVRPPTPLVYKVGGDVWPRFVCLLLFFAHHCSTDPVCLNPLDVTLMDCRDGVHGGVNMCVIGRGRSFRWEMLGAWSSRAAGKERGESDLLLPPCCGQ